MNPNDGTFLTRRQAIQITEITHHFFEEIKDWKEMDYYWTRSLFFVYLCKPRYATTSRPAGLSIDDGCYY